MQDTAKVIRIFIGGPSDTNEDGLATVSLIRNQIQTELGDTFSIIVNNWKDEHFRFALSADNPQGSINDRFDVRRADIVLMLFRESLGEAKSPDSKMLSASAWELEEAAIAAHARAIGILQLRFDNPPPRALSKHTSPEARARHNAEYEEWLGIDAKLGALHRHISSFCERWKGQGRNVYTLDDVTTKADEAAARFVREILNAAKPDTAGNLVQRKPNLNFEGAPYCGLYEFKFEHRDVYFGRSAEISELHAKCAGPDGSRLLIVHGVSGVGKSSLIQAGLLPTFVPTSSTGKPVYCLFDPAGGSRRPFLELARAVKSIVGDSIKAEAHELADEFKQLFSDLQSGDDLVARQAKAAQQFEKRLCDWLTLSDGQSVIPILINQFENVYYVDLEERETFFNLIVCAPHFSNLRVIASMRQDAYDKMLRDQPHVNVALGEGQRGNYTLNPPSRRQLREMIIEPWRLVYSEPSADFLDLAEEILNDAQIAREAALPLVSQALYVLHNDRKATLTQKDYLDVGRLEGVIKSVAEKQCIDSVYLKLLFRPLSTLRDGRWATQTARKSALVDAGVPSAIIERLAGDKVRLLYIGAEADGTPEVSLAHEILFDAWPALVEYAKEGRLHESERVAVIDDARNWDANGSRARDIKLRGESYRSIETRLELEPDLFAGKFCQIVNAYIAKARELELREGLIEAINAGFPGEVVDLLRKGAQLDLLSRQGGSSGLRPQFWAAITGNDYEAPDHRSWDRPPRLAPPEQSLFVKFPKLAHSIATRGMSVAHFAAACGHLDLLKRLVNVDPQVAKLKSEGGSNLVTTAALGGNLATVKYLVKELELPFDEEDDEKCRPIIWAVQKKNRAVTGYLEKCGARVAVTTQDGFTTLTEAARSGDLRGAEDALKDDSLKIDGQTTDGQTALMIATAAGHAAVVSLLLDLHANVALKTKDGATALHFAALQSLQTPDVIHLLIGKGADRNARDDSMETPLFWAANSGKTLIVRTLLSYGVETDLPNNSGMTPLLAAANVGHAEVVRDLLRAGADVGRAEKQGWTALHFVADDGDQTTLHELLLHRPTLAIIDRRTTDGWTPLLLAASKGYAECLVRLIEAGADWRIKLPSGPDALALAIKSLSLAAVQAILAPDVRDGRAPAN